MILNENSQHPTTATERQAPDLRRANEEYVGVGHAGERRTLPLR